MFNSKKNNDNKISAQSGINSVVKGTVIEGNIKSGTDIRFDGHLKGDLRCNEKVVIASNALIEGNVSCKMILIQGKVEGDIKADQQVHIMSTGIVVGNLTTSKLIIEDGAVFNGASFMGTQFKGQSEGGKKSESKENQSQISKVV